MNGFILRAWAGAGLAGAVLTAVGCNPYYHNVVDPCWPERYNYMARAETNEGMANQVRNGHVLDQTVFSNQFELGTDRLTPGGLERLVYLARRRPAPDPVVYVQSAAVPELVFNPAAPDRFVKDRNDLNAQRVAAVQKFLDAEMAGTGVGFTVLVHNPANPGIPGVPANNAVGLW